jgi:hypothetical protein
MGITIDPRVNHYLIKGVEHQGSKYEVAIWKAEELHPMTVAQHLDSQKQEGQYYVGFPLFVETMRQLYRIQAREIKEIVQGHYVKAGCLLHNTQLVVTHEQGSENRFHLLDRIKHNSNTPLEYEVKAHLNGLNEQVADPNTYRYMGYKTLDEMKELHKVFSWLTGLGTTLDVPQNLFKQDKKPYIVPPNACKDQKEDYLLALASCLKGNRFSINTQVVPDKQMMAMMPVTATRI